MRGPFDWRKWRLGLDPAPLREYTAPIALKHMAAGAIVGTSPAVLAILLLFFASMRYTLNAGYIAIFSLVGLFFIGAIYATRALSAISLQHCGIDPAPLGAPVSLPVSIRSAKSIEGTEFLHFDGHTQLLTTLQASGTELTHFDLPLRPITRGLHPFPVVTIQTRQPFGIWRTFVKWQPLGAYLVYPTPEPEAPRHTCKQAHNHPTKLNSQQGGDEFNGMRQFIGGESLKRLHWKTYAKTDGALLLAKSFTSDSASTPTHFNLDEAMSAGSVELALSRLTTWILHANQLGQQFGLNLGLNPIPIGSGPTHLRRCLEQLALYGQARSTHHHGQ